MRKSYNPFKMFGSYVGAAIGLAPFLLTSDLKSNSTVMSLINILLWINPMTYISGLLNWGDGALLLIIFSSPIWFFLIGWGIHSLIRKLK